MIYFDNAATTFPKPLSVVEAVNNSMINGSVNAGRGVYPLAQQAEKLIFETRGYISSLLQYDGQVVFAPSATLALNQVLQGLKWKKGDLIYTTPLEHNSVARCIQHLINKFGVQTQKIPLNQDTLEYDLEKTEEYFFRNNPKVVVLTHVSNVCGLITPIFEIAELAKKYNAIVVIDGAQAGPLIPLKENTSLIDYYIFSGHKTFYGPFGIAGFITNNNLTLEPIIYGGTGSHSELLDMPDDLPYRYEVGSHNIVSITGLNAACKWLIETGTDKIVQHERELLSLAVEGLREIPLVRSYINKDLTNHLGTLSFTVNGFTSQEVGMFLSQNYDIASRAGLHCSPWAHDFLATLPNGTTRLGFGWFNTKEEVKTLIDAIEELVDY